MFEEHSSVEEHVATSFRCAHQVYVRKYKYKTSARVNILFIKCFQRASYSHFIISYGTHIYMWSEANTHSVEQ